MTPTAARLVDNSESIQRYVERVLAEAPALTAAQRDKIAELLRPARAEGSAA